MLVMTSGRERTAAEYEKLLGAGGFKLSRVVPTPGHSAGSVTILTAAEAIVGDLLMGGYAGGKHWPHVPTLHYFAEDLSLLRTSIAKLLEYAPARVYTGHGGPLDLEAIRWRFG